MEPTDFIYARCCWMSSLYHLYLRRQLNPCKCLLMPSRRIHEPRFSLGFSHRYCVHRGELNSKVLFTRQRLSNRQWTVTLGTREFWHLGIFQTIPYQAYKDDGNPLKRYGQLFVVYTLNKISRIFLIHLWSFIAIMKSDGANFLSTDNKKKTKKKNELMELNLL